MTRAALYRDMSHQAEIDAEYDPARGLAEPGSYLEHYVSHSAAERSSGPCWLNIPYGPTLAETLDIFPANRPDAPVFVFIHGGYWRALAASDFSCMATGMRALNCTTVVVDYALAPTVSIDEITRQVRAAVCWIARHIHEFGGDPQRMAIGGHSAGAQLAAMSLLTRWQDEYGISDHPFKAAVLVSGIYDLAPLKFSYLQPQIQLDDGVIQRNSPLFAVRKNSTPILVTWGAEESKEFARQSEAFHESWTRCGNASERLPQAKANHYSAIFDFEAPDSAICRWLIERLTSGGD